MLKSKSSLDPMGTKQRWITRCTILLDVSPNPATLLVSIFLPISRWYEEKASKSEVCWRYFSCSVGIIPEWLPDLKVRQLYRWLIYILLVAKMIYYEVFPSFHHQGQVHSSDFRYLQIRSYYRGIANLLLICYRMSLQSSGLWC